ncbi:hypothetical protein EV361DRAFT_1012771 [Lentinula raphanica]|uniref:Uncharacterized protein n=1 Tax=Lentinula raphanica TaxID=153919 RepID=A0AA38NXL1_9AGAR|nr:hypothetical protein F5880DRAFT_1672883 [Lentinula raphanica]KAJ3832494.1 hypothetical protein F5878DRAFT_666524 [Lentinula raphanica]KAJ3966578.1 hypothetical protein EV361DRAFT_1012771 [Lentinula raphanica]
MSTLKRKNDAFYLETTSSKRATTGTNIQRTPLRTFVNGQTHLPPTPLSKTRVKQEKLPPIERSPEHNKRKEAEEEEEDEPESQLPIAERERIQQNIQQKYDELVLDFNKKSFEVTTLEGKVKVTQAQLSSSQEQLRHLTDSQKDLIHDFQQKQQKSIQTEQRLRAERNQYQKELASVQAERDTAVSERNAAQMANSQAEEELQDYRQFFVLHARLLTVAQACDRAQ